MKYALAAAILTAMIAAGCGGSGSGRADEPDESSNKAPTGQAKRAAEDIVVGEPNNDSVRAPGFFARRSSGTRKNLSKGFDDLDDPADPGVPAVKPVEPVEPVKAREPRLVKPDAEVERRIRLAKLYIDNASSATSAVRSKFLHDKAAAILKEVIEKHPQDPASPEARKLLAEVEGSR